MRSRRNRKWSRARTVALALGVGAVGSLALAPASFAAESSSGANAPAAGSNCQSQDGKIAGRGSTLQLWLQYDLAGAYSTDVCGGGVAADANANGSAPGTVNPSTGTQYDITDPGSALYSLPNGEVFGGNYMTAYNYASAAILGSSGANAGIGSGAGLTTIGCRAEAFSGTDIPVTATQLGNINGAVPAAGGTSNGKNCDPVGTGTSLDTPFPPLTQPETGGSPDFPKPGAFPNPGDQQCNAAVPGCDSIGGKENGVMVFPVGISAVANYANLPPSCFTSGVSANVPLTTADMENIWGGSYLTWNALGAADPATGLVSTGCNATVNNTTTGATAGNPLPITRVVRSDNSGTTQAFDNYLADSASSYSSTTGICSGNLNTTAATWGHLQNNQALSSPGSDVEWAGNSANGINGGATATCSAVIDNSGAGGPAQISTAEVNEGSIGYADYSDTLHDTNHFQSQVAGDSIDVANVQSSTGTAVQPNTGNGGSNCTSSGALPTGGNLGAVGIPGRWNLTAQATANAGPADIAYAKEGSTYPICGLTWDFVWTGSDGNTPPAPTASAAVAANATSMTVSSVAGLPDAGSFTTPIGGNATPTVTGNSNYSNGYTLPVSQLSVSSTAGLAYSGSFTVTDSAGVETLNYTGINGNTLTGISGGTAGATIAIGAATTFPLNETVSYTGIASGNTLFGVTGDGTAIASGATLTFPSGTGGPEANLSADQRRTLYSFFTYVISPAAQATEAAAGYAAIPSLWISSIRAGFQNQF
jgi:hypothetical protein